MLSFFFRKHKNRPYALGPGKLTVLAVICLIYIIYLGSTSSGYRLPMFNCDKGPLLSQYSCVRDQSRPDGWHYSYAAGQLDNAVCRLMSLNEAEIIITLPYQAEPERLLKTECSGLQLDYTHICYASQRLSEDGNSRIASALTTDSHCDNARFFRGANAMLVNGKPQQVKTWKEPYAGIPEIKK